MDGSGRLSVVIAGLVQGVGFRHAAMKQAKSLGLTGWVRNLRDGRVEGLFEGDRDSLTRMLQWCERGPALSRVETVKSDWQPGTGEFQGFEIRF